MTGYAMGVGDSVVAAAVTGQIIGCRLACCSWWMMCYVQDPFQCLGQQLMRIAGKPGRQERGVARAVGDVQTDD